MNISFYLKLSFIGFFLSLACDIMENTKLPKFVSQLRRPAIQVSTASKPLATVLEKPTTILKPSTSKVNPPVFYPPVTRNILRRRSKSVTDLRAMPQKPLHEIKRQLVSQTSQPRPGQKRGAENKGTDASKPKVSKPKIASWDFKAKFHDLQPKYQNLQQEFQSVMGKLTGRWILFV